MNLRARHRLSGVSRTRLLLTAVAAVAALAVASSATAGAATFHTPRFYTFGVKVGCGAQLPELGGMSCFSQALPQTDLDGYVELHGTGEAKLGERGDSPWRPGQAEQAAQGRPLEPSRGQLRPQGRPPLQERQRPWLHPHPHRLQALLSPE